MEHVLGLHPIAKDGDGEGEQAGRMASVERRERRSITSRHAKDEGWVRVLLRGRDRLAHRRGPLEHAPLLVFALGGPDELRTLDQIQSGASQRLGGDQHRAVAALTVGAGRKRVLMTKGLALVAD